MVNLSANISSPPGSLVAGDQGLQPGAGVQDWEELFFEVNDDELEEEGDVVAAVVAVPNRQKEEDT